MSNKFTTDFFISRAGNVHGGRYDYSKVNYIKSQIKVVIICPIHGEFYQAPNDHLKGRGCPLCSRIKASKKIIEKTINSRPDLSHVTVPSGSIAIPVGNNGRHTIIDEDDYNLVCNYNWHFIKGGYVYNSKIGLIHRLIMNPDKSKKVDHVNHDVTDNRRCNLRVCSHSDNTKNRISDETRFTSKYKGVCWYKKYSLWVSRISCNGKRFCLGYFDDEVDAAKAYDEAAKKLHGEFAYLNFK